MLENLSAVPDDLRRVDRWVCYRTRPKPSGKLDKIPMQACGAEARTNDPSTWTTFDAATAAAQASASLAGVGFVFHGDGIVGIDLDDAVGDDGLLEGWAVEIVDVLDSYTEWSPSGKGVHIYVRANLPQCARKRGKVEVYGSGRFFTVTGNAVDGSRLEVREAQAAINQVCERYLGWERPDKAKRQKPRGQALADDRTMARALVPLLSAARSDDYHAWIRVGMALKAIGDDLFDLWEQFSRLSPKYDRELCIRRWQGFKPRVAKASWIVAQAREDAGVERVRQALSESFPPERAERMAQACATAECEEEAEATVEISTIDLASITPGRVEWLWKPYIPRGMVSMVVGHPGVGKSTMLIDLAARVSTVGKMPDGQPIERCRVGIGMLEDDLRRVTLPRLIAAGADLKRLVALNGVDAPDGSTWGIKLPNDAGKLEKLIKREGLGLLIMDPITAYMGSRDSNSQQEVRDSIQPLSGIAERTGCAIMLSNHTSKAWKERDAAFVGQGSIAFTAVARTQLLLSRAPHDRPERVLWVTKSNVGPDSSVGGRAFIQRVEPFHDVPVCSWSANPWHESLEQFLAGHRKVREAPARDGAMDWLEDTLGGEGWVPLSRIVDMAESHGIKERTLKRTLASAIESGTLVKRGGGAKGTNYALAEEADNMEVQNA